MPDLKTLHDSLEAAKAAYDAAETAFATEAAKQLPDGGEATSNPTPVTIFTRKGDEIHKRVVPTFPAGVA